MAKAACLLWLMLVLGHSLSLVPPLLSGRTHTAAFAAAKGGQRWLAQALAEICTQRCGMFLIIVDGIVDMPATRAWMPNRADEEFIPPADIAEMGWYLAHQPRGAWTFELDARPYPEKW